MKLAIQFLAICISITFLGIPSYAQLIEDNCDASGALGANILINPGFESNTAGPIAVGGFESQGGWNFEGDGSNTSIETTSNVTNPCFPNVPQPYLGTQMVRLTGGSGTTRVYTNPISVTVGNTYEAGVWMLSPPSTQCPEDNLESGISSQLRLEFLDMGGSVIAYTASEDFTSSNAVGGWFQFRTVSVAPAGTVSARLNIVFDQSQSQDGAIYYDEASLQEKADGLAGSLTCNDNVNVSVNSLCASDITVDMLIEGSFDPLYYDFYITNAVGVEVDLENSLIDYLGQVLTFHVEDICSDNTCWGNLNLEDKLDPTIACDCPVGGEDLDGDGTIDGYSEDCTLSCYELPILKDKFWDNLRDDLVPEDVSDFIDDNVGDNCGGLTEDAVSYYDVYIDLGCEGTLLRRTWTVDFSEGASGENTISCTREYFFEPMGLETADTARIEGGIIVPVEDSIILPFAVIDLDCGAGITPAEIAAAFDDPASEDQDTDDDGIDPDELDIDLVVENNEGIPYAYPHYYVQGRNPSGPHAQAIDTEVCNLIVAYTDQEVETCELGCSGNRKVLRNWTILDWCAGQYIEYQQVIKAIDTEGPFIEANDVTASVDPWKCAADVKLPQPEHLSDNCDSDISYTIGAVSGGLSIAGNAIDGYILLDAQEGQTYTVEYVSEDCCGNIGTTSIQVTVVDQTPPVPVTKEFIVLSLTNIGNPDDEDQGIAKLFAHDVDNGSYDGCTGVTVEIRRAEVHCESFDTDTLFSDNVKFCCEDLNGQAFVEIDIQVKVSDENGNVNYTWSTVRLEDKSSPTQVCPEDMILTCDMDFNDFDMTDLPQSFSACGEIDLMCDEDELIEDTEPRRKGPNDGFFNDPRYDGVEVPAYDPSCGFGAIRRQFRSCASCVQWFVIEPIDAFDPNTIVFPDDIIVDCDDFDTGEPEFEESTCNLVGVTITSDTFLFEDGACFKILNHWSIINWCEYDASNPTGPGRYDHTQVVKIIDTQDPEMTVADSLCFAVDVDCVSKNVQLSASATDEGECGSDWLKWEVVIDVNADWTEDYVYATALPRLENGIPNPFHIAPTGNGEDATITLPDGLPSSKIWHRSIWRVFDGCGNTVSSVRYFQITDKKAPTPYCLNLSTAVMSESGTVELWAIDFNIGSFDNCTADDNLLYTFTDVAPPPRDDSEYDSSSDLEWYNGTFWYYNSETGEYEDQDDYGDEVHRWEPGLRSAGKIFTIDDADASGFVQIPVYVWDECGNQDFCLVNLRLIDNMGVGEGRIAGKIMTEASIELEGVMTQMMSEGPEYPLYSMTDASGEYKFDATPFYQDYEISANLEGDVLNGVSTLDLVFIQKHILGQLMLDSPYKMIAADVNNDSEITALDLIELRKLILGVTSTFPENKSWKIVKADSELTVANAWEYSTSINIHDFSNSMLDQNFVGIKMGDVNGSAELNSDNNATNTARNTVAFSFENREVAPGDLIELTLSNKQYDLYGYQFTLNIPGFELVEVKGNDITDENLAVFGDKITMSYNTNHAVKADSEIFTMMLRAKKAGEISDMLALNSSITKAEAYVGKNLDIVDVALESVTDSNHFELYQNEPNPFAENTTIGFELPESGEYILSLYDVTGKLLLSFSEQGSAGYNEKRIKRSELDATGIIYYRLETNTHNAVKHMIVIK